jgi:hypothetical protein
MILKTCLQDKNHVLNAYFGKTEFNDYKALYDSRIADATIQLKDIEERMKGNKVRKPAGFTNTSEVPLKLEMFFDSISKYKGIMEILVTENFCQQGTYIWKDQKKGNKTILAAILKYLHQQKYYKNNSPLTINQIREIALNTFGMNVAIDTIKKANPANSMLSFIPPSSTLSC